MKNPISKNLFFLFIIIFTLFIIAGTNYIVDPYNLLKKDVHSVDLIFLPSKLIYPYFKLNKDQKCEHLVIGGSESFQLFGPRINPKTHYISRSAIEEIPDLLEAYLDLHSEIKQVTVCLSTVYPFRVSMLSSEQYNGKSLRLREIFNILFSTEVITKSFNILTNRFPRYKNSVPNEMITRPNYLIRYHHSKESLEKKQKDVYQAIDKTIEILESKQVKYTFVITPINAIYSAITSINIEYKEKIDNFKRYLVQKVPYVYDFSFVNKFSSINLFDENNFYWLDFMHISYMFGIKYYKILFDTPNSDKSIYFILTKDNVEQILFKENEFINKYIELNTTNIEYYVNISREKQSSQELKELIFKPYSKMPEDLRNEVVYFNNNVYKLESTIYSNLL